jgi:hypothetical protein
MSKKAKPGDGSHANGVKGMVCVIEDPHIAAVKSHDNGSLKTFLKTFYQIMNW